MWKENCDNHNFKNWTSPILVEILLWRYQNLKYSTCSANGVTKFRNFVTFTADWPTGIGQVKLKIVETRFVVNSCPNWNWLPLDHEIQIGQMWDCCYSQEIKISKNNVNTNFEVSWCVHPNKEVISDVPNSLPSLQLYIQMSYNPISVQCSLFLLERGFKFVLLG